MWTDEREKRASSNFLSVGRSLSSLCNDFILAQFFQSIKCECFPPPPPPSPLYDSLIAFLPFLRDFTTTLTRLVSLSLSFCWTNALGVVHLILVWNFFNFCSTELQWIPKKGVICCSLNFFYTKFHRHWWNFISNCFQKCSFNYLLFFK